MALVSGVCDQPSLLGIPVVLPNNSIVLPYDPNDVTYSANGFNWAAFYQSCLYEYYIDPNQLPPYTPTQSSPYFSQVFSAYGAHQAFVNSTHAADVGALPAEYLLLPTNFTRLLRDLDCSTLGMLAMATTNEICVSYVYVIFLAFVAMFFMPIVLMIMTPFVDWITPNLYRVRQADLYYQSVSKARQGRIKSVDAEYVLPPVPQSTRSLRAGTKTSSARSLFFYKKSGGASGNESVDEFGGAVADESTLGGGPGDQEGQVVRV